MTPADRVLDGRRCGKRAGTSTGCSAPAPMRPRATTSTPHIKNLRRPPGMVASLDAVCDEKPDPCTTSEVTIGLLADRTGHVQNPDPARVRPTASPPGLAASTSHSGAVDRAPPTIVSAR
jgi:hypothetical protein